MSEQNARPLDSWISRAKQFSQLVFLLILIVIIIYNWNSVNICVNRFLHCSTQVSIANVLNVSITPPGKPSQQEKWAAFYRVSDRVKVLEASFDDKVTGFEYLDITAITPINLGGSYIGDGNDMMFINERDIRLQAEETLRIYTYAAKAGDTPMIKEKSPEACKHKSVTAKPLKKKNEKKGIFKTDVGEGDRIVLIDREKRVILDLDYWWVP
jgi:hypothetical protein